MPQDWTQYPALTNFSTPAVVLVLQDGVTYQTQLSPILSSILGTGSVTESALADGAVTNAAIANGAITGNQIAPGSITGASLAPGTISGDVISAGTITGTQIGPNTVTGANIQLGSVNADVLAANTITSLQLGAACVGQANMAQGAVTTSAIADGAVTGQKLAPQSIGGTALQLDSISGANIQFGAVQLSNLSVALQDQLSLLPFAYEYSGSQTISGYTPVFTFTAPGNGWFHVWVTVEAGSSAGSFIGALITNNAGSPTPNNQVFIGQYGGTASAYVQTSLYLAIGQTATAVANTNVNPTTVSWQMSVVQFR